MSDPVVLLSTGDVVGPAGGVTDNSMVLFSGTSGKLIKGNNAQVTAAGLALLDDVNAAAQRVTLGLGNVDNTSDINKPISTATQTALNLKATIASPAFTGIPTAPTPSIGTRSTAIATMQNFANEFGATISTNGYQKLPSGLIIQWGYSTTSNGVTTLPIVFPNANLIVLATTTYPGASYSGQLKEDTASRTLSSIVVRGYTTSAASITTAAHNWLAIGY